MECFIYIGETSNLVNRIRAHFHCSGAKTTAKYGVDSLICYWECESRELGRELERYLKTLTRDKKFELISNPILLGSKFGVKLKGEYKFVSNAQE